jgi:hypothetical protein
MITQIQRWRRFFAELAGVSPEAECETDKGWSIVFFFSNVRIEHSDCQQYFLTRKMACRSCHLPSRHAVRRISESPLDGLLCVWFQGGSERPEYKTPQLTLPCARMVFHGRNHPENSCNRTLAEPPGNSWNAPSGRFPLPLPAPRSASPTRVRAGRDQSPTDLPGELLNLASIMALRVCFWPFNLVFFLDANQLVIAA